MIRHQLSSRVVLTIAVAMTSIQARAVVLLYEPFDYPESNFLSATTVGAPNTTTSPIGYLAPSFNNWYGTGIDTGGYQVANDGQIISSDLTVPGLAKPNPSTRSLTLGGTGHTFRLSLNSSTVALNNRTGPNLTDTADPLAGTDATPQPTDTGHTGYYSIALRVTDITGLFVNGGVLLGFNNVTGAQIFNPTTAGAALTIRPKAGGGPGEFQLGLVKQGTASVAGATWDAGTYTTNSTVFVVGKYQTVGSLQNGALPIATDDLASLWINPSSSTFGGFEPAGAITNMSGDDITTNATSNNHTLQSFILRQNGTAVDNRIPLGILYDELRVGTTWADVTPGLPGDYNRNGTVDAADYVLWRNGGPLANEVDQPTIVNEADYTEWRARFNIPGGPGVGATLRSPSHSPPSCWRWLCPFPELGEVAGVKRVAAANSGRYRLDGSDMTCHWMPRVV